MQKANRPIYIRLSAMMFLQLFVNGCTMPILSLYLKDYLHFTGAQTGWILATSAVSALISPLIGAFIADRLVSAERLLAISHFAGASVMAGLYSSTHFTPVLLLYLLYWMIIGPTFALTTAITFHHASDAAKNFGGIRLWGTLGWFVAAWVFSFIWVKSGTGDLRGALKLAALSSVVLGLYSLSLPVGLIRKTGKIVLFPKDSIKVILKPEILSLSIFCLIITFVDRFYMFGAAPFLKSAGFSEKAIMPVLSIGQVPEILGLGLLGLLLSRIGLKKVLLTGVFFEIARFAIFFSGKTGLVLFLGISMHGLTYAYFFIPCVIFLDSKSDKYSRAGAHQLFSIITGGIGSFLGNLMAGFAADLSRLPGNEQIYYPLFWIVPLVLSVIGFSGILFFLKDKVLMPAAAVETEMKIESFIE